MRRPKPSPTPSTPARSGWASDPVTGVASARRLPRVVERVQRALTGAAAVIASLAVALLAIGMVVDVALRYFVGSGVAGMIEYAGTLMVVVVFFGLAQGQRRDEHVGMSFVVDRLPRTPRYVLPIIGLVAMGVFVAWMTVETTEAAWRSYRSGEFRFGLIRVPLWPSRASIPIGLLLLLGETMRSILLQFRAWRDSAGGGARAADGPAGPA